MVTDRIELRLAAVSVRVPRHRFCPGYSPGEPQSQATRGPPGITITFFIHQTEDW